MTYDQLSAEQRECVRRHFRDDLFGTDPAAYLYQEQDLTHRACLNMARVSHPRHIQTRQHTCQPATDLTAQQRDAADFAYHTLIRHAIRLWKIEQAEAVIPQEIE